MLLRSAVLALTLGLVACSTAAAVCPPTGDRDAAACDVARQTRTTVARCAADAQTTETCADRATGTVHAIYLTRAASEWRKAALSTTPRDAQARRWLAHATVLDERVQDDPDAPLDVRKRAKHDEQQAKAALIHR